MRIGVIVSMKAGLEAFILRELQVFAKQGCLIALFPTKFRPGLYNAPEDWSIHFWHPVTVLLWQPFFMVRSPTKYLSLFFKALKTNTLVDFILGWYFSQKMSELDAIYATFGDHKLYVAYYCKQILQKPLIVTIRAYELYRNPNPDFFPLALSACDRIVTETEFNKERLVSQFGIEKSKIDVVRINVDLQDYRPEKKFIVLIVAFFVERKGHSVLFDAIKLLGQKDIEIWVVGGEGAEDETIDIRGLAKKIGIDQQVAFFGKLSGNALKAVYQACDVFCLPCHTDRHGVAEGFPTVLAEAMAFEKPVITTRHVEIPRIVEEILVDENDVSGLAQAIRTVYGSTSLRNRLGKRNREIAEEFFSTKNAEKIIQILSRLIRKK